MDETKEENQINQKKEVDKSQLIWVGLAIVGILIIWLVSKLIYK